MGRELRRIRLSARLSQAALARKVGVARSTVSRMETGAHSDMSVDTVLRLASACGFTITFTAVRDASSSRQRDSSVWLYATNRKA
ncbi:helix-turn-helix transcriptional regulator [Paraburkholderia sp. SIMBA_054]|uniref:helix-turn-helix transcriptional regulator n=1 Tax=Paraburkholderia sp. SIMBA_054 TaxID=3085795 RepID=UPI003979157C